MSTPQFLLHFSKIKGKIEMEIFSAQNSSIFNRRSNRKGAGMGLFNRKKKEKELEAEKAEAMAGKEEAKDGKTKARESKTEDAQAESKETGMKQYIKGAGGTIVSKSILEGRSKLKWLFRQEDGHGNGWIAFGDTDTQEYVDNPENMAVVDFNVLANIEPAVVNVFYLPYGADLEFRKDETGAYFVDTGTGEEIREQVKPPLQEIFEKNLKFLNKETYPEEFFQSLFQRGGMIEAVCIGEADFPTGEIVLSDPIVYLGSKYMVTLEKKIPKGSYPVELSICHSQKAGLRIAAARLVLRDSQTVRHEIAMPKGSDKKDRDKPGVWAFFGVDAGLACFSDVLAAEKYRDFISGWKKENPGKNEYYDYFASFFRKSYEMYPEIQRESGDFLLWQMPGTGYRLPMFASGLGDGIYSGYWGLGADGEPTELVIPFLNPEYL